MEHHRVINGKTHYFYGHFIIFPSELTVFKVHWWLRNSKKKTSPGKGLGERLLNGAAKVPQTAPNTTMGLVLNGD